MMSNMLLYWIWTCAYINCAGWALSAMHQLNARGWAGALLVWLAVLLVYHPKSAAQSAQQIRWQKFRRRFRRPLPLAFLALTTMAFLGGVLHPPDNYDAMAYRIPRILQWLAAGQWHWIHTTFPQINNRSCGIEWVSAPFIALLKSDRLLFLINSISFLFLPGLIFSVFTQLGMRRQVAWHWMWIVPTGYCYLLQAGSVANDLFGAPFALAAVGFALRAKVTGRRGEFFASILAAAVMTSAKSSSVPLGLPWAIAILPVLRLAMRWPVKTLSVCLLAVFASALPTIVLNQKFSSDWSGADLSRANTISDLAWRAGANTFLIPLQNLVPPVFPLAGAWNRGVERLMPPALSMHLHRVMAEREAAEFTLPQMQIEENAGLGFGVSLLVFTSFLAAKFRRQNQMRAPVNGGSAGQTLLRWSPVISLLALMTQYNLSDFCRILTPYYALLMPTILTGPGQEALVKKCWWRTLAFAVFAMAAGLLIVSPARPLFPIMTILQHEPGVPARIREVYTVYDQRNDAFAPVRAVLPPGLKVLGVVTPKDPETSLWRPFGSRQIMHVFPEDTGTDLKRRGVQYILVKGEVFGNWFRESLDAWLKRMDARVVKIIPLDLLAATGPADWYLVELR
jgi:hypothetical protein